MSYALEKSQPAAVTVKSEHCNDESTLKSPLLCDSDEHWQGKVTMPPSPVFFSCQGEIVAATEVAIDANSNLRYAHSLNLKICSLDFFSLSRVQMALCNDSNTPSLPILSSVADKYVMVNAVGDMDGSDR